MIEKKKYYDELNIFRGLIIVWVVIGHSTYADSSFLGFLHNYAYSFHMSAFFLLSGFLFKSKLQKSKDIKSKLSVIGNRTQRLIVPYLFFTAISYVLKLFFEKYALNSLSKNIVRDALLCINNPNGGIWFLYALFFISLFGILFCNISIFGLFLVSLGLRIMVYFWDCGIPAITYTMYYSVFFFGGAFIALYYDKIISAIEKAFKNRGKLIMFSVITVIMLAFSFYVTYLYINAKIHVSNAMEPVIMVVITVLNIITWYFASLLADKISVLKKINMTFGDYGMDIYMLGYYVQTVIRVVFKSMLGTPYIVYAVMMCVFGLLLPIPLSKYIVRKIKIARALMLGDFSRKDK